MTSFFVLSNYVGNCLNKTTRRIVTVVFVGKSVDEICTEKSGESNINININGKFKLIFKTRAGLSGFGISRYIKKTDLLGT